MATIQPNDTDMANAGTLPFSSIPDLDAPLTLKKTTERRPRVDVEPLYAAVKGAISDADWAVYKTSLTQFLIGNLNQEELSFKLGKILNTTVLEHAHNTLVAAIYANIWRDPPEAGIASWVSSTDKPSSSTVKGQGDESEKRLKYEVMQLSRRERKRLKTIPAAEAVAVNGQDGGAAGTAGPVNELVEMKRGKQPEIGPVGPAGGYKTSKHTPSSNPSSIHLDPSTPFCKPTTPTNTPQTGTSKSANATPPRSSPKPTNSPPPPPSRRACCPRATSSASPRATPPTAPS